MRRELNLPRFQDGVELENVVLGHVVTEGLLAVETLVEDNTNTPHVDLQVGCVTRNVTR